MTTTAKTPEIVLPGTGQDEAPDLASLAVERKHSTHEVAAAAVAAEAEAEVKARVALALARPRNAALAEKRILEACRRPAFADLATWERPVGKKKNDATGAWEDVIKEGPSIRLAEECARNWGNIYCTVRVIFESDEVRVIRVGAMDLETNWSESDDITIQKVVERSKLRKGDVPIKTREGSNGQVVYVIPADEGALRVKERAEIAKIKRGLLLQLLPSDTVEAAFELAKTTAAEADATQQEARRQQAVKAFAKLNVSHEQLEKVVGKPLAEWGPVELGELRRRHAAVRDGEMSLKEFLGAAAADGAEPPAGTRTEQLAKALADKAGKGAPPAEREPGADG